MNTQPLISLIFVNYHSAQYLAAALESFFSLEEETALFEVIVVNNDSSETGKLKSLQGIFSFLLIENASNTGFGAGNNRGAQRARGNILGFINPDTLWTKASLRQIKTFFDAEKNLGILGMMLLDQNKEEEAWGGGWEPTLFHLFQNNISPKSQAYWNIPGLSFPDWVSGCALFVQKDIFSRVSGFDEQFFLYFEDVDLCKKVRDLGFSVARHTDCSIIHLGGKSERSTKVQKENFYTSQKKYYKKHRPLWEYKILTMLHLFLSSKKS